MHVSIIFSDLGPFFVYFRYAVPKIIYILLQSHFVQPTFLLKVDHMAVINREYLAKL